MVMRRKYMEITRELRRELRRELKEKREALVPSKGVLDTEGWAV